MCRFCTVFLAGLLLAGGVLSTVSSLPAAGDDKGKSAKRPTTRKKPLANTEALDVKVSQAEAVFVRETEALASEYFDAGHLDKAEALLKKIEAIEPDRPGVKEKLKVIEDTLLSSNEVTLDVDASGGWQTAKLAVQKDEPIRIDVEGTYRFVVNGVLGPDGFPNDNIDTTMVPGGKCGALMGVIVSDGQGGRKNKTPFLIGKGLESFAPPATGLLFLRVNAPAENKNTGKLKVTISGSIKAL